MHNTARIPVWDPFVRLFHWTLVAAFTIAFVTEDDFLNLHSWAGYTVLALVLLRIVWGLIGPAYARFSSFVFPLPVVRSYLKDVLALRARRYLGHNPAGGLMIVALLVSLLLTTLTGLLVYGAVESAGPLAGWLAGAGETAGEQLEELHEFFANFTLLLVVIHVGGVLVESLLHRENLVRAMFSGYKRAATSEQGGLEQ